MLYCSLVTAAQILLESLPISSSLHIMLLERFIGFSPLSKNSIYLLHIPTVIMVACFFKSQLIMCIRSLRRSWRIVVQFAGLIIVVDTVTVVTFIIVHLFPVPFPAPAGVCITMLMLSIPLFCTRSTTRFGLWQAVALGGAQSIALLPGISRFATVYSVARMLGIAHRRAFEITWLCAVPIFCAPVALALYAGADGGYLFNPVVVVVMSGATFISYYLLSAVEQLARADYLWLLNFYMIIPLIFAIMIS